MSESGEQAHVVFVKRVYCPDCGQEARGWRTSHGDVALPAVLPMADVRQYLNGGFSQSQHPHKGPYLAELEPVQ